MKEELISLETEKLAKEKGFNFGSSRATQSLLQRWLREKHNIYIDITTQLEDGNLEYDIDVSIVDRKNHNYEYTGLQYTYEKALEKGLFEALKLIKL